MQMAVIAAWWISATIHFIVQNKFYSYHALPVTDLITPGSPIQALFAPEQHFFWWLLIPLIAIFFV